MVKFLKGSHRGKCPRLHSARLTKATHPTLCNLQSLVHRLITLSGRFASSQPPSSEERGTVPGIHVPTLLLSPTLPKEVIREPDRGGKGVPARELTGGMDAGEAFAALGHQIGVTCAVHFRVHHSIWKAAVKEIGARSTKDTMDIFNIKRCRHKRAPSCPPPPCPAAPAPSL